MSFAGQLGTVDPALTLVDELRRLAIRRADHDVFDALVEAFGRQLCIVTQPLLDAGAGLQRAEVLDIGVADAGNRLPTLRWLAVVTDAALERRGRGQLVTNGKPRVHARVSDLSVVIGAYPGRDQQRGQRPKRQL